MVEAGMNFLNEPADVDFFLWNEVEVTSLDGSTAILQVGHIRVNDPVKEEPVNKTVFNLKIPEGFTLFINGQEVRVSPK